MNIAFIHYRVGETDGVSLEMDKWKNILDKQGHNTFYIAGSKGTTEAFVIEEMYYRDAFADKINNNCYVELKDFTEEELIEVVETRAKVIEDKLIKIIEENNIDIIVPNNVLSLGWNVPVGLGVVNAIKESNVKVINHHHDFYWERTLYSNPTIEYVKNLLDTIYPPQCFADNMSHVVINSLAQTDLKNRKALESTVVPNVFDFKADLWAEDEFNKTFKDDLGIKEDELLFLQATRVTNRKGIELAIDVIAELNKKENMEKLNGKTIVLALVGLHEGFENYEDKLINHAKEKGVKLIINPDLVDHSRHMKNDKKVYSLWDAYVYADFITYPSIYEGWGNQFLEGTFAKKPQIVFEYSVFGADIKSRGFNIVTLGDKYETKENGLVEVSDIVLKGAAQEVIKYLTDDKFRQEAVEENFKIANKYYSMEALKDILNKIFV